MIECAYVDLQTRKQIDVDQVGKALIWLAAGALLGLAVALPYDRLLGLPGSTGTFLGAAVWAALLGALHAGRMGGVIEWQEPPGSCFGRTSARLNANRARSANQPTCKLFRK
jgi:hypothetical protein